MAVALTPFTALCGFRDPAEILVRAEALPELAEVLGEETVKMLHDSASVDSTKIRKCYEAIFQAKHDKKNLVSIQEKIYNKIKADKELLHCIGSEFLTLFDSFPGYKS